MSFLKAAEGLSNIKDIELSLKEVEIIGGKCSRFLSQFRTHLD